jgi:ATP:ADP antiporter, AAA family
MKEGSWIERVWPIRRDELWKVVPLFLMKFFVTFVYVMLHDIKDALVVTSKGSGAEAIPVLKGWVVLPLAIVAMLVYSKLSTILSKKKLFYVTISSFFVFFFLYAFILYPLRDLLTPHETSDWLVSVLGKEREHIVAVYRYWMNSIFFFVAELWGGLGIGLLFWGFANQVSRIDEAKRFYAIFSSGGNLALLIGGALAWYQARRFSLSEVSYDVTLRYLMVYVLVFIVLMGVCYWWINKVIEARDEKINSVSSNKKKKPKLSVREGLKFLMKSRYLYLIAFLVISYGLVFNMMEVSWKAMVRMRYPSTNDYQSFVSGVSALTGLLSVSVSLFLGSQVIHRFGWRFAAMLPPIIIGGMGIAFFGFYFLGDTLDPIFHTYGTSTLMVLVIFGAVLNAAGKTLKYSFFDTTKEMAFIPLDEEAKVKGKAAIDVVAARFGKSGSSWIQLALMEIVGTGAVLGIAPFLLPFIIVMVFAWMHSVNALSDCFNEECDEVVTTT